MAELAPEEVDLRGNWVVQKDRSVVADATERRIEWLTTQKLERIANDSSGWETLYRDPRDGRLWELTDPQSGSQGGGPRHLHVLSRDEATAKYEHAAINKSLEPTAGRSVAARKIMKTHLLQSTSAPASGA